MREYTLARAAELLRLWSGDPATLAPIAAWEHRVFRFSRGGLSFVLRLSDPDQRPRERIEAELAFVRHLDAQGIPVSAPVACDGGGWMEATSDCHAVVFPWIDGEEVDWNSTSWEGPFFRSWGSALARVHRGAERYCGPRIDSWAPQSIDAEVAALVKVEDAVAHEEWTILRPRLEQLQKDERACGMIHGDATPLNLRYRPGDRSEIVFFDFAGCGDHWFAMDVAVALLYFRRDARREEFRRDFLSGYTATRPLSAEERNAIGTLLRLRLLEVLLSRRKAFGPRPDQRQRAVLSNLRLAVAERFEWPLD